jgi:hypothetical protein
VVGCKHKSQDKMRRKREIWKFDTQQNSLSTFDTKFVTSSKFDTMVTNSFKKRDSSHFLSLLLHLSMFSHVIGQECPWLYLTTGSLASFPPVLSFLLRFILTDRFFLGFHGRCRAIARAGPWSAARVRAS